MSDPDRLRFEDIAAEIAVSEMARIEAMRSLETEAKLLRDQITMNKYNGRPFDVALIAEVTDRLEKLVEDMS